MEAQTDASTARRLYFLFKGISPILTTVTFQYNDDSIQFQGLDQAKICLLSVHINTSKFHKYSNQNVGSFGIHLGTLTKILKYSTSGDIMTMRYDPTKPKEVLQVILENSNRKLDISIPLIDIDEETMGIPDISYDYKLPILSSDWHEKIDTFSIIDAYNITLKPTKTGLEIIGDGESGSMNVTIKTTEAEFESDVEIPQIPLSYPLVAQLKGLSRAVGKMFVCIEKDVPVLFQYGDPVESDFSVQVHIAPKIMDDDD